MKRIILYDLPLGWTDGAEFLPLNTLCLDVEPAPNFSP